MICHHAGRLGLHTLHALTTPDARLANVSLSLAYAPAAPGGLDVPGAPSPSVPLPTRQFAKAAAASRLPGVPLGPLAAKLPSDVTAAANPAELNTVYVRVPSSPTSSSHSLHSGGEVVASCVLERATRWMPLPGDTSLLGGGKGQLPMHLSSLVRPAVEAFTAEPLSDALMAEAIAAVMLLGERAKVFPSSSLRGMPGMGIYAAQLKGAPGGDNAERDNNATAGAPVELHVTLWTELKQLAAAYGVSSARHVKLARVVSTSAEDAMRPAAEPGTQQAKEEGEREVAANAAAAATGFTAELGSVGPSSGGDTEMEDVAGGGSKKFESLGLPQNVVAAAAEKLPAHKRKRLTVTEVQRDASGAPLLPINLGPSLQILNLGTIDTRKGFHSENYIWPIGFRSKRLYTSMLSDEAKVWYTCDIVDGGGVPEFRITPPDCPDIHSGISATAAWGTIIRTVTNNRCIAAQLIDPSAPGPKPLTSTSTVSGPEMYGFAHPTISRLILELPGAEVTPRYPSPPASPPSFRIYGSFANAFEDACGAHVQATTALTDARMGWERVPVALNNRSARGSWANVCSTPIRPPKGSRRHATRWRREAGTTAAVAARRPTLHPAR